MIQSSHLSANRQANEHDYSTNFIRSLKLESDEEKTRLVKNKITSRG